MKFRPILFTISLAFICGIAVAACLIAFGTDEIPPPKEGIGVNTTLNQIDYSDLPKYQFMIARDGQKIAYREYSTDASRIILLVHGSSSNSQSMHALARFLSQSNNACVYTMDMRGHGLSEPKGHIDYIGQLEDDIVDIISSIRQTHPDKPLIMAGFSAGGGFVIRFAGSQYASMADAYLFLSPFLHHASPTNQPDYGGWAVPHLKRIIAINILNKLGIKWFNHLPVLEFSIAEEDKPSLTPFYSYNLMYNFRPHENYKQDIKNLSRPAVLLVGSEDEDFRAQKYAEDIGALSANLRIQIIDGVSHMGMLTDSVALESILEWVRQLP